MHTLQTFFLFALPVICTAAAGAATPTIAVINLRNTSGITDGETQIISDRLRIDPNELRLPPAAAQARRAPGDDYYYRIYVLDRQTGVIQYERAIGPLPSPINGVHAAVLDHRLVVTIDGATIVIDDKAP